MLKKLYPCTIKWAKEHGNLTDQERAAYAADRVRRYIECWEILGMMKEKWVSSVDISEILHLSRRPVRRALTHLAATGLIDLRNGRGVLMLARRRKHA